MADDNVHRLPTRVTRPRFTIADLRGRLGYFSIADRAIELWPDTVMDVMARCIVLQCGRCNHAATVYLALSREFGQIDDGETPPFYEWVFEKGAMHAKRFLRDGEHGA